MGRDSTGQPGRPNFKVKSTERRVTMTEEEVVTLMEDSKTEEEWNTNRDLVKAACGGYPDFWYRAIVLSGVMHMAPAKWYLRGGLSDVRTH